MTEACVGIPTETVPPVFTILADQRNTPSIYYISTTGGLERLDRVDGFGFPNLDSREKAILLALLEHTVKLVKDAQ